MAACTAGLARVAAQRGLYNEATTLFEAAIRDHARVYGDADNAEWAAVLCSYAAMYRHRCMYSHLEPVKLQAEAMQQRLAQWQPI